MAMLSLLYLCLLCDMSVTEDSTKTFNGFESSTFTENLSFTTRGTISGETGTIINDIGTSTLRENVSFTIEETVSRETGTIINDIGTSTLRENVSFTTEETGTIINDIGTSTLTENFSFTTGETGTIINDIGTTETDSRETDETATEINAIGSNRSSNSTELFNNLKYTIKYTISTETVTVLGDNKSSYNTTGTEVSECDATKSVDILQKYQQLINFTKHLDELFEQTMEAPHSFVKTKNQTTREFTTNLAKNYLKISRKFVEDVQLQNMTIRCKNNSKYEKYKIDNINEYEEKLEIVEILSNQLGKIHSDAEFQNNNVSEENVRGKEMALFNELNSIVKLNKRIKELQTLLVKQNKTYEESQKIRDLDDVIATLTEIIKLQNETLHVIRNSESFKYLYSGEYRPKSNIIRRLINSSNVEEKINKSKQYLIEEHEERELVEEIIQLNKIIRPIVLGTIFVVGIIANGVLLLVFIRHADMRTAPNVMIINLNVSDILGLTFNILLYILETLITDWTLGTALCKLYRFCRYLTLGLSIYSIVVISLQRCVALTDYFSFGFRCRFFGKFQPILNVLFVWVLTSAFASPRAIKAKVESLVCWSGTKEDVEFFSKLEYVDFAVYCIIPLIIIAITSGLSSLRLKRSVRNMPGEAIGQEKAMKARVVSSNVFLALTVVFAICYVPYFMFMAYSKNFDYNAPFMTKKYVSFSLYCLIHSNSCFNPISLFIASSKYRKYMRIYFCCGKFYAKRKNSDEMSGESNESNATIETRM